MLPQRRKSAEEIAKLRESLGIPGETQEDPEETDHATDPPATEPPASGSEDEQEGQAAAITAAPKAPEKEEEEAERRPLPARKVRSLRKS